MININNSKMYFMLRIFMTPVTSHMPVMQFSGDTCSWVSSENRNGR